MELSLSLSLFLVNLRCLWTWFLVIYIVGNKADLYSQRTTPREKAEEFTASVNGTYFETSAKMDTGE